MTNTTKKPAENSDENKNSPKSHDTGNTKYQKQVETEVKTKRHVHNGKHQKDSKYRSQTKTKKELSMERSERKKNELQFLSDIRPKKQPLKNNIKMIENLIRNEQTSIQKDKDLKDRLTPKAKKLTNPVTDLVDAYYITKWGWEEFCNVDF